MAQKADAWHMAESFQRVGLVNDVLCVWNRLDPALLIINHQVVWPSPKKFLRTYENLGE